MSYPAASTSQSYAAPGPAETSTVPRPAETRPLPNSAEVFPVSSAAVLNRSPETAKRLHRAGCRIWRRAGLQGLAVLGAVVVGCTFGYVVARNDRAMQIFFSATVSMGLFFVFSACATQLNRRRRGRRF